MKYNNRMIEIAKALKKENLDIEWERVNIPHYGKEIHWTDKKFRFKAVEDGELVGTVCGKFESGVVYIAALITKEGARGKGVGTMLIQKAEEFGKKHGAHKTWLVTGKNWPANTFYKKLGFEQIGSLPDFYFHTDFVIYARPIKN
jgi:ribosomal protein S18 acetylase RimI-like enzyme